MSKSWGHTDNDQYTVVGWKMPFFNLANYAKTKDENTEKVYVNLTGPTNQQEVVTIHADKVGSVSTSFKKNFPQESKGGYMFSIKDEEILRDSKEDGTIYDDYCKVIITCYATNGTNASGGIVSGADWLPRIQRALSRFNNVTLDISDSTVTIKESQTQLDHFMHAASDLVDANSSQA